MALLVVWCRAILLVLVVTAPNHAVAAVNPAAGTSGVTSRRRRSGGFVAERRGAGEMRTGARS
jgi:hypothetical protein